MRERLVITLVLQSLRTLISKFFFKSKEEETIYFDTKCGQEKGEKMADVDKLIDMLEQIKQTDPEFGVKASKALDALISEEGEEESTESAPPPAPKLPPERVVLNGHHSSDVLKGRQEIVDAVTKLGLVQQNYESDKESLLDQIERHQEALRSYIKSLHKLYNLPPEVQYELVFPRNEGENPTFVKQ